LFPSGVGGLSEQEIRTIINDGGENSARVARGMQGTTALVALLDPTRTNLWVASLGDCQAGKFLSAALLCISVVCSYSLVFFVIVLGTKEFSGAWKASILSSFHNGGDTEETARIRREHPGELECISHDRVLGAIALTRGTPVLPKGGAFLDVLLSRAALGDLTFKLPPAYTTRVFLNSDTPFLFRSDVHNWIRHNHTPPYLSNVAEVRHVPLGTTRPQFLIMCSDGLLDLYRSRHSSVAEKAGTWVDVVGGTMMETREIGKENLALRLLRHALGGEQRQLVSRMITVEMTDRWMDDTTILVLPL
jgi:pyruvate dehydrogenase phosphatase